MSACSDPAAVTLQLSGWYESRVHEAKASANVIKAGDEMLGTMIDLRLGRYLPALER